MEVAISDDALPVVKESLEKEILLLRAKIRLAEKEIAVCQPPLPYGRGLNVN